MVAKFLNNTKARHWSDDPASDNHGKLRHPQDAKEQVEPPFVDLPWTGTADRMNSSKARSRVLQEKKPQTYVGSGLSGSNGSQIFVGFPQQSVGNLHENRSPEDALDDDLSEMPLQARPAIESHGGHRVKRFRREEFIKMQPSSAASRTDTTSSSSLAQPSLCRQTRQPRSQARQKKSANDSGPVEAREPESYTTTTESASDLPPISRQNASGVLEREHALPSTPTEPQDITQTSVSQNMDSSSECATSAFASNVHPKKLHPHEPAPLLAKQRVFPDISFAFSVNISKSTNKSVKLNGPFQKKTLSELLSEFPLPGNPKRSHVRPDGWREKRVKDRFMEKVKSARRARARSSKRLHIEIEMGPRHFSDEEVDKESDDELIVF
ncbi:hypothetical protein AUP68_10715 [Ilyonectria robusta]